MSFVSVKSEAESAVAKGKSETRYIVSDPAHSLRFDCGEIVGIAMGKFELTKSIEARKLNSRTMAPLNEYHTIPFGAIIDNLVEDRDMEQFSYLGDHYQYPREDLKAASRPIQSVA